MACHKKVYVSTDLSWDEKNPKDYTYKPSEATLRLRQEVIKQKK
jgi:hypothetical protein